MRPGFVVARSRCLELSSYSKHQQKVKERAMGKIYKKSYKQLTDDSYNFFCSALPFSAVIAAAKLWSRQAIKQWYH